MWCKYAIFDTEAKMTTFQENQGNYIYPKFLNT